MGDIAAIAGMESSLLNGPPRALRAAASKLAAIRNDRLVSDKPVPDDEIGRILVAAISAYRDDRAQVEREREGRIAAEEQVERLRNDVGQLKTALNEKEAFLKAELSEHIRRETERDRKSELNEEKQRKRRDWMLFSALLALASLVCLFFKIPWAAGVALTLAAVSLLWSALAQDTPSVSLRTAGLLVPIVLAVTGIVEKWPDARRVLGISEPQGSPDSSAVAAAPKRRPPVAPVGGGTPSSSTK
jgi:ABC-type multidrug transport system fused ATPase/permease subunit